MGMAYVVRRPRGRFEIRESVHTPRGPRARSLASFSELNEEVLGAAARRAQRPFDPEGVRASARRCGVLMAGQLDEEPLDAMDPGGKPGSDPYARFVAASRRMASNVEIVPPPTRKDPGESLIELLAFAEAVARSQPPRPWEPLAFPPLARLIEGRTVTTRDRPG